MKIWKKQDDEARSARAQAQPAEPAEATPIDPAVERLCEIMHEAYETAARQTGWETQKASRKPWAEVPEANKATMRVAVTALRDAVVRDILSEIDSERRWQVEMKQRTAHIDTRLSRVLVLERLEVLASIIRQRWMPKVPAYGAKAMPTPPLQPVRHLVIPEQPRRDL